MNMKWIPQAFVLVAIAFAVMASVNFMTIQNDGFVPAIKDYLTVGFQGVIAVASFLFSGHLSGKVLPSIIGNTLNPVEIGENILGQLKGVIPFSAIGNVEEKASVNSEVINKLAASCVESGDAEGLKLISQLNQHLFNLTFKIDQK